MKLRDRFGGALEDATMSRRPHDGMRVTRSRRQIGVLLDRSEPFFGRESVERRLAWSVNLGGADRECTVQRVSVCKESTG